MRRVAEARGATAAVIVFGEIFGAGVQDMHYGQKGRAFRVFDISVDGKYLDVDELTAFVAEFTAEGVRAVPVIYRGPFSLARIQELTDGPTTVCDASEIKQPFKGREGIVIRPVAERFDERLGGSGRVILKSISVDYHERKNADRTEDH
jgi:RNA ligase (TIGR02306 family)